VRVLLIGHYGKENLGDDVMLEGIRKAFPEEHELCVVAGRPIEGLETYPQRPLSLLRAGLESDWIWMGGGSIIHDEGSSPRFKHRGLMQAVVVFLVATITRCRLAFIGMGLGPLRHAWKRRIVAELFGRSDYVSLRDSASMDEWRQCAPSSEQSVHRTFDSCVVLRSQEASSSKRPCSSPAEGTKTPEVIGLNLLPYFRTYEDDPEGDEKFLDLIVHALRRSLQAERQIRLFTFNKKNEESEQAFIEETRRRLSEFVDTEIFPYSTPRRTIEEIDQCDAMIAMRYHGSVMAYLAGVPQVVIGYHEKCTALARDIGCAPRSVIDIRHLHTHEPLVEAFTGLQEEPASYCASLPLSEAVAQFESAYFPREFSA
jgi:polysaccharide pyruvyl transferase WcaK-like protein